MQENKLLQGFTSLIICDLFLFSRFKKNKRRTRHEQAYCRCKMLNVFYVKSFSFGEKKVSVLEVS